MSNRFEKRSKLTLITLLFMISVVMLLAFELLLGVVSDSSSEQNRSIRLRENAPLLNLTLTPSALELAHSENLENKAYRFRTDDNGFLYPSFPHGNNADLTLAFIGGSTTECMYVDEDLRFPVLVGKQLSNAQRKVNAINAGVSGNDSLNSINAYLNKVIPINPDIAILMHNINDLSTLLHEENYWNNNPYRSTIIHDDKSIKAFAKAKFPNIFEVLFKVKTLIKGPVDEFAQGRGKSKNIDPNRIYDLFEENLRMFISISNSKNITPVLMTQANRLIENPDHIIKNKSNDLLSIGIDYAMLKKLFDGMNQRIRKVANENNVLLIDLAAQIPQSKEFMVDTVHFNNKGSTMVAKLIAEQLETMKALNLAKN